MGGLLASVFGLALLDSLNPSAIAMTLYLLTGVAYARKITVYLSAVFFSYFAIGTALLLGIGAIATAVGGLLEHPIVYGVQGIIGAVMLIYGVCAPSRKGETKPRRPRSYSLGAIFLLGLAVSVIEFSTALPYLGAIGLITNADLALTQWLPILVGYNLILVAPPFLLLGLYRIFGARLERRFAQLREKIEQGSRGAWLTVVAIVGFFLLGDSLRYFQFFGLISEG